MIVYLDGCGDSYGSSQIQKRWLVTGAPTVTPAGGRRGGNSLRLHTAATRIQQNISGAATYIVGVACKLESLVATDILTFREGTTDHVIIRITATGAVEILRAPSTQLAISPGGKIFAGQYAYLEALVTIHDSTGVVTVNLNGTQLLNATGQDTNNGGAVPQIDNIEFEGSTGILHLDDHYICDTAGAAPQNTFLGDTRVETIFPEGDGNQNDFPVVQPASPATHFDKVDDLEPDDTTTHISSETAGDIELYQMQDLLDPEGSSQIFGAQLLVYARKNKVTAKSFQPLTRVNAANFAGASNPLNSTFEYHRQIWQQNPDTAVDWNEAEINSAEFGILLG